MKTRIYFLDNLRTFLILLVIVLHAGLVYESVLEQNWIVIDQDQNSSIGLIRMYLDVFVMSVMFFISGYFIRYSALKGTSTNFIKSKFKRIMIPWLVAVLTMIPAYKAIFLYARGLPQEVWYSYFHLFQRTGGNPYFYADNPTQGWLWFLPVLFMFQIIYLVLTKSKLLSTINISLKTGVILTFVIGLIYSMAISELDLRGWYHSAILHFQNERLLIYFMVFLLGSLCNKLKVFESNIKKIKYYIISNVVLTLSLGIFTVTALNMFFNMIDPSRNFYFISVFFDKVLYYSSMLLSMLSFLQILVHVFRFNLNKTGKLLSEMSRNSYYVYIIHMVVLGVIAVILLPVALPAMIKFLILAILTFVVSNILVSAYHGFFRNPVSLKSSLTTLLTLYVVSFAFSGNLVNNRPLVQQSITPTMSLHEASLTGNIEVVRQHIAAGSDLNVKDQTGGSSPLIIAAVFGKTEVAQALIIAGADVNFQNNEGSTPLHTAAFFCRTEIVELLLNNNADKSIRNKSGATALESVTVPMETVAGIYNYFLSTLSPLGLKLDLNHIEITRPVIAEMIQNN